MENYVLYILFIMSFLMLLTINFGFAYSTLKIMEDKGYIVERSDKGPEGNIYKISWGSSTEVEGWEPFSEE